MVGYLCKAPLLRIVKRIGATLRIHNLPVFLAGGLDPTNIHDAITEVRPFGVNLCSGVRTNSALDPVRLTTFMTAVHLADESRGL